MTINDSYKKLPNQKGYFGAFGGRYVSETLMPLILEVEKEYYKIKNDQNFKKELNHYMETYVGRPSPLFFAQRITEDLGGPKIYFKRDELNHTGAHKINNCMGQILLAKKMGKKRIIAETGAGQHGVATATVCALFGLPCIEFVTSAKTMQGDLHSLKSVNCFFINSNSSFTEFFNKCAPYQPEQRVNFSLFNSSK